jgi:hypothetical protein
MAHDPRAPIEPSPRMEGGPPAFMPPPRVAERAAGRARPAGEPPASTQPQRPRAPTPHAWRAALLAGAIALTVYVWGAAPSVLSGDSAELAMIAAVGGVSHPTGYPTFVLLGQATRPFLPGDPARRATLMCALAGAASVALFAVLLSELSLSWAAVFAGALLFAGSFTLWWSSIRTEVYTTACTLALFALWRVWVARRTLLVRDGLLASFAIGLGLTGHLSYAPALALAGLWLVASAHAARRLSFGLVLGAALALLLGLLPYLYTAYADRHFPLTSYLHYAIEPASGQYGLTPATFDTPVERLRFLVFGAEARPHLFLFHPRLLLMNLGVGWGRFAAFEIGPLTCLLALAGLHPLAARDRGAVWLLAAIALVTPLLGGLIVTGPVLNVFMMASVIAVVALAACGLDAWASRAAPLAMLLALAAIALPHALRTRAVSHPLGASWMRMVPEGPPEVRSFLPQLRHETAARRVAEQTLAAIPESSFVAATWDRVMPLKYLQSAEHRRTDLTIDPWYEPAHAVRLSAWQHEYSLRTRPVVVVGHIPGLVERLSSPEVHALADGTPLYIERAHVRTD